MRFLNFPIIYLGISYLFGIYLGFKYSLDFKILLAVLLSISTVLLLIQKFKKTRTLFLGLSLIMFALLGSIVTHFHLPKNQPDHIVHLKSDDSKYTIIYAEVSEKLRPNAYNYKFVLSNLYIDNQYYKGKILWHIDRESDISKLFSGDKVLLISELKDFNKSKNPQYFDYAAFMNNRNIYKVIYENNFIKTGDKNLNITNFGAGLRAKISKNLEKDGFSDEHLQLIQALILGQKQEIEKETYNEFAEVGVVHILAVSGLHVGIVLAIILFILKPVNRLKKHGRKLRILLSLIALWGFAVLAGFSPSVLRACTMFSFLVLGQLKQKRTNSLNMLFASAIFLLTFRPQLLFEVGFQLSYAAVFSIVMLFPVFSKLYFSEVWLPKLLLSTIYVSIAAQIGVLPFQLYYFHQFPGLFLIGNLVIIPFLGILLSGGILCITLSLLGILFKPITELYAFCLDLLIGFVGWLSNFKYFIIKNIFFTQSMFIGIGIMVFFFIIMSKDFRKKTVSLFLLSIMFFSIVTIYEISLKERKKELIVFHRSKGTILGFKNKNTLDVFADSLPNFTEDYTLKNYKLINRIKEVNVQPIKNAYDYNGQKLIIIDSSAIYNLKTKADIILLSGSPDLHLEKLIKNLEPKLIVADGKNYKSYVERWKETAFYYAIPFHSTYEDGYINVIYP